MAGLRRRGLVVQPFKCGPDFLDTSHHTRICGRTSRNLDTWMLSEEANRDVVRGSAQGADVAIAEGMMGLFDGKSGDAETGSSAEIAKRLKLPVVLVVDAGGSARSIAAVVLGFESFDPGLPLAGVILNRVGGERHFAMLQTAIQTSCKTKILGWLPREPQIAIPERHLGLHGAAETSSAEGAASAAAQIEVLAALAEKHFDLDGLLGLQCGLDFDRVRSGVRGCAEERVRIGVASDPAFSFYYEDNLDLLREHGAAIVPFSPLRDSRLPDGLDALYLGGGYPELYAEKLSRNREMLDSVRTFAASGRPVYAECGGMIYLSDSLGFSESFGFSDNVGDADGGVYAMAGVLPLSFEMTSGLVQFGYVTVELTEDCLLGRAGTTIRGHSFHTSRLIASAPIATSYRVHYSMSGKEELEGFRRNNVLASYIHLHFRANPDVADSFVTAVDLVRSLQMVIA